MKTTAELLKDFSLSIESIYNDLNNEIQELESRERLSNTQQALINDKKKTAARLQAALNPNKKGSEQPLP